MNTMSPEFPRRPGETFLEYLHRYAIWKGYLPVGSKPWNPQPMPKVDRQPGEEG